MSMYQELRCDRCSVAMSRPRGMITMNYHHPRKLDICEKCEGAFTLWLGKHPLWNTPIDQIISGQASGEGYPTREQIAEYIEGPTRG